MVFNHSSSCLFLTKLLLLTCPAMSLLFCPPLSFFCPTLKLYFQSREMRFHLRHLFCLALRLLLTVNLWLSSFALRSTSSAASLSPSFHSPSSFALRSTSAFSWMSVIHLRVRLVQAKAKFSHKQAASTKFQKHSCCAYAGPSQQALGWLCLRNALLKQITSPTPLKSV